jgi:hypothetical protein
MLETLAYSNFYAPRPRPIDAAVFFDLLKIRKCVDEATDLAVRAASGVTSIAANNGVLGNAAALGLTIGNNGTTRLSKERKQRMRELAAQKLSQAYHLDEIAASVATMQSTSTLEDLAQLVLQRNPNDYDARYVHFFHEKIPSRMMAEYTSLAPLDRLVSERPGDGSPYRTRALTRIFKEEYDGAAKDLTEGLAAARWTGAQHRQGQSQDQLVSMDEIKSPRDWRNEPKLDERDHPSSLEAQLLFHRAGIYLRIACQAVRPTIDAWTASQSEGDGGSARQKHLEHRKLVKTSARKALRDYLAFLSSFDYSPGVPPEIASQYPKADLVQSGTSTRPIHEVEADSGASLRGDEKALAFTRKKADRTLSFFSAPEVYTVAELFAASPPACLPVYPPETSSALTKSKARPDSVDSSVHEVVTYHPLLTEALHSMLICHVLLQTSATELRRHAYNTARVVRLLSGYPIFLHARSTSRADWTEILRRTNNWLDLGQSWSALCHPVNGSEKRVKDEEDMVGSKGSPSQGPPKPSGKRGKDGSLREAILEALADERVVDEESFHRAVKARESGNNSGQVSPIQAGVRSDGQDVEDTTSQSKWMPESPKDFPGLSTERAEAVTCWILEAPLTVEGGKPRRSGKKSSKTKKVGDNRPDSEKRLVEAIEGLTVGS